MTREELISRTQQFALRIIHLSEKLMEKGGAARVLARQLTAIITASIKTKRQNIVE